jgi:hypothetical protein
MDILNVIGTGGISDDILKLNSLQSLGQSSQVSGGTTQQTGEVKGDGSKTIKIIGTESLFNPFYIFRYSEFGAGTTTNTSGDYDLKRHNLSYDSSSKLLDKVKAGADRLNRQKEAIIQNPTAVAIKTWADEQGAKGSGHTGPLYPYPYALTDFVQCKHYGLVPNNRLLTLRRYPVPIEDNLQVHQDKLPLVPIAQAVTWFGGATENTLNKILGMSFGFNWKDYPKEGEEIQDVQGNEIILEDALTAAGINNPTARQALIAAFANQGDQNPFAVSGYDKTLQDNSVKQQESGAYANRVLGPINVITKTQIRDRGFTFTHKIDLTFEYKLRAIGTVNPKVAMLDLISNFLSLTYNRASFWGGGYRYFQRTGPLLPGFNTDSMEKGDYAAATKDITAMLTQMIGGGADDLKTFMDKVSNDASAATGFVEKFKTVTGDVAGSKVGQNIIASRIGKLHQAPLVMRALADGRAVGEWHLMVGNPMDPIAVIGNLCLDSTSIEFGEELGAHDFPTEVKFKVSLTHGRPRAKQDIESMFNHGGGDLFFSALQPPSSAQNSYGEYTSKRIADSTGSVSATFNSIAATAENTTFDVTGEDGKVEKLTAGQNTANYFRPAVERKYGAGFGKSGILPDYFTKLYTKD